MNTYTDAPDIDHTSGAEPRLPDALEVAFDCGRVVALRASEMVLDSWDEGQSDAAASIALFARSKTSGRSMALFIEQSADNLRRFAASCLRAADKVDGGRGKQ